MIGLPADFACFGDASKGGGVIQVSNPYIWILLENLPFSFLPPLTFLRVQPQIVYWFVSLPLDIRPWSHFEKSTLSLRMEFYCPNWWPTARKRFSFPTFIPDWKCWFVLYFPSLLKSLLGLDSSPLFHFLPSLLSLVFTCPFKTRSFHYFITTLDIWWMSCVGPT